MRSSVLASDILFRSFCILHSNSQWITLGIRTSYKDQFFSYLYLRNYSYTVHVGLFITKFYPWKYECRKRSENVTVLTAILFIFMQLKGKYFSAKVKISEVNWSRATAKDIIFRRFCIRIVNNNPLALTLFKDQFFQLFIPAPLPLHCACGIIHHQIIPLKWLKI